MPDDEHLAEYVHRFCVVPLPGVTDDQFENHILNEVLPGFEVTSRPIGHVELRHSLMKRFDDGRGDRYVWEIRLRFLQRVKAPDSDALDRMDGDVREALSAVGILVSMTAFQEVGAATTQ